MSEALIGRERHSLFLMKSDFKISFVHSKVKKKRPLETELICEQQVKEEKRNDLWKILTILGLGSQKMWKFWKLLMNLLTISKLFIYLYCFTGIEHAN